MGLKKLPRAGSGGSEHQLSGSIWKGQTASHSSLCPQHLAVPSLWTAWMDSSTVGT